MDEQNEKDPDETPTEIVIERIQQGLHKALTGELGASEPGQLQHQSHPFLA